MRVRTRFLANADLLSKNWAGGHWLWITKGYLFNNILLLAPPLDPPAAPPSVTCLRLSSSSQSALSHVSLLLPSLSQQLLPQAFWPARFVLCHARMLLPGISRAWAQAPAVICNGHLQWCTTLPCNWEAACTDWLHPQALVFYTEKCSCLKHQYSWRGVTLAQAMLHLLGVLMLVLIFIQEGG